MKTVLAIVLFLVVIAAMMAQANSAISLSGGKMVASGTKFYIEASTQAASTSATTGQCMGILCGVTYPN